MLDWDGAGGFRAPAHERSDAADQGTARRARNEITQPLSLYFVRGTNIVSRSP